MNTIQENNAQVNKLADKKWKEFYSVCAERHNLSDRSIAALLGISRQSVRNYEEGKTSPCVGTIMRINMVTHALNRAAENDLLPAPTRRKQDALVQEILK